MAELIRLSAAPAPDLESGTKEKWQDYALCAEISPHIFFPGVGGSSLDAKLICEDCPVSLICLKYQLDFEMDPEAGDGHYGVFGGLSERERRRLVKIMKEKPLLSLEAARNEIIKTRKQKGNRKGFGAATDKAA